MKKGILLLTAILLMLSYCNAQTAFRYYQHIGSNSINALEYLNGRWIALGSEGYCDSSYISVLDDQGSEVGHYVTYNFGSTYNTSTKANGKVFGAGTTGNQFDYYSEEQRAFIHEIDTAGLERVVVEDTTYHGGFFDIALYDTLVFVSASKHHWSLDSIHYVVAYGASGNLLWSYKTNWEIKGIVVVQKYVYVYGANKTISLKLNGQLGPHSINKGFKQIEPYFDIMAAVDNDKVQLYDTTFYAFISYNIAYVYTMREIDKIAISDDPTVGIIMLGRYDHPNPGLGGGYGYFTVGDDYPFSSIDTKLAEEKCADISLMIVNDSTISFGGTERLTGLAHGFVESIPLYNSYLPTSSKLIVESSIGHIGAQTTIGSAPARFIYYDVTVRNTGPRVVTNFTAHSSFSSCAFEGPSAEINQRISNVTIPAFGTYTFTTTAVKRSVYQLNAPGSVTTLYLRAENGAYDLSDCENVGYDLVPIVGIGDVAELKFEIHPNPFTDQISFIGLRMTSNVMVYNATGELVFSNILALGDTSIDLSNLSSGIYYVEVVDEQTGSSYTQKLVKY